MGIREQVGQEQAALAATSATTPQLAVDAAGAARVSFGEKLAYGCGDFASQMVFNPIDQFIVFFYTDIAGIAAASAALVLLVSRAFDLLNPIMGLLVDRTKSKYGKARPWILWMALPLGISAALLFVVPNTGQTGKIIYAFITYNLCYNVFFTATNTPYGALLALITPDQQQRATLSITRMVMAMGGATTINLLTLPLVERFGGGAHGWERAFMLFGFVATGFFLITFRFTKERVQPSVAGRAVQVKAELKALLRNKYWAILMVLAVNLFLIIGLYGANLYYCRYVLQNVHLFGPLMTAMVLAQVVGMLLVAPLVKRWGKRNTALVGTVVVIAGQILMCFSPANFSMVLSGSIIKGLGASPLVGTMLAMVADVVDYGEWKSGVRTEGLVYGALALATRMTGGLGGVVVGWVLAWGGYTAGAAAQPESALAAIKALFLYMPLGLYITSFFVLWVYKLEGQYSALMAQLHQRRSGL